MAKKKQKKKPRKKHVDLSKKDRHGFPKGTRADDIFISGGKAWQRTKGHGDKKWKKLPVKEA